MGIKIFDVVVNLRALPEEIVQQRLDNWRAPWESDIREEVARRDVATMRRMKRARAQAQVEIIASITENIDRMRRTENIALPQVINLRVIEALDEAISTSSAQSHIPGQVLASMALETTNHVPAPIISAARDKDAEDGD